MAGRNGGIIGPVNQTVKIKYPLLRQMEMFVFKQTLELFVLKF